MIGRLRAIAYNTFREAVRDRVLYNLIVFALLLVGSSLIFGQISIGIGKIVLVNLSLYVVAFIKAEVILSFLGLSVPIDMVSWGTMLSDAQTELVLGFWWQLAAATLFMAVFVTAFALLTDALRDAMDPKLR